MFSRILLEVRILGHVIEIRSIASPETVPGWAMSRNGHLFDEAEEVNGGEGRHG